MARNSKVHGTKMALDPGLDFIYYTNKRTS